MSENTRIQDDTESLDEPVHINGNGKGKESKGAAAKTLVRTQTGGKAQNAPDSKLVRNLSFSSSNEKGQKIMWKVLK